MKLYTDTVKKAYYYGENLEPVSYTHLDVYKRQVKGFVKLTKRY